MQGTEATIEGELKAGAPSVCRLNSVASLRAFGKRSPLNPDVKSPSMGFCLLVCKRLFFFSDLNGDWNKLFQTHLCKQSVT